MITIDSKDIRRLEVELDKFPRVAYAFATRDTVNTAAMRTMREARKQLPKKFIIRREWVVRGIQAQKTRKLKVYQQYADIGSLDQYMTRQEFGGTRRKNMRRGVPIPTSFSTGEGEKKLPRRKNPKPSNRLVNIQLAKRKEQKGSRGQKNVLAVWHAVKAKQKHVFLKTEKTEGIFRITGRSKNPKRRELKMVHNLEHDTVKNAPTPWLRPATDKIVPQIPAIYAWMLRRQLQRNRLFQSRSLGW